MNTVNDLIRDLNNIDDEYKDKPITIVCPNGIRVFPKIKLIHEWEYDLSSEVKELVLFWD